MADVPMHAFVDDSGCTGLNLDHAKTSSHFVAAAVLVPSGSLPQLELQLETIRRQNFGSGEMKSSSVGANDERRQRILLALMDLQFRFAVLVVDKAKVNKRSGLRFHASFEKFIAGRFLERISLACPELAVVADEEGDEAFRRSMTEYLKRRIDVKPLEQFSLFPSFSIQLVDSAENVFVQAADMIAGTYALGYETERRSPQYPKFFRLLKDQLWYGVDHWPPNIEVAVSDYAQTHSLHYDEVIARYAIRAARAYCHRNRRSRNEEIVRRVAFARYMLAALTERNPSVYVTSKDVIRHVAAETGAQLTKRQLCNAVVGPLRDEGLLIASSAQGYKIPIAESEVCAFIDHTALIVPPMLRRIETCQRAVRRATNGLLDPLASGRYRSLRQLVAASQDTMDDAHPTMPKDQPWDCEDASLDR